VAGIETLSLDVVICNNKKAWWFHQVLEYAAYFKNVRVLSIPFAMVFSPECEWKTNDLVFPRLESLHLPIFSEEVMQHICEYWKAPHLRILSTNGLATPIWFNFMEKWSSTLQILHLENSETPWSKRLQLPALKELHINRLWDHLWNIDAPNLEKLCIFWIQHHEAMKNLYQYINRCRTFFPKLRRLRLRGYPCDFVTIELFKITKGNLDTWSKAGLEVDMLSYH
jgi:hypothetical protein